MNGDRWWFINCVLMNTLIERSTDTVPFYRRQVWKAGAALCGPDISMQMSRPRVRWVRKILFPACTKVGNNANGNTAPCVHSRCTYIYVYMYGCTLHSRLANVAVSGCRDQRDTDVRGCQSHECRAALNQHLPRYNADCAFSIYSTATHRKIWNT